ncbi:kinase-like domain-containing protein [Trichophaea hybrida]|nr:kinase-like domain-containing protein [Trichophaea hybrida]
MRVHEAKHLGRGAQFQVYGQCHGVGDKTSYIIDQPYIDNTKKVWKREIPRSGIDVAIKRTLFTIPFSDQNLNRSNLPLGFGSPDQLHNFQLEVLALCHSPLRNHRNIVQILGWGLDFDPQPNGTCMNPISPILIVEHANCTLRDLIVATRKRGLPVAIRQKLCLDVCNALTAVHDSAIIHGDIKTDNVLVYPAERNELCCVAKISDFGLSIQEEEAKGDSTRCDSDIGTPGWQAPELRREIPVSELIRCDYFSFGLLVWSVISSDGECPLKGGVRAEAALSMATLFLQSSELPESLKTKIQAVMLSLLQNMPQDRDSSLKDVSTNLSLDSTEVYSIETGWAKELFKRPVEAMTHAGVIERLGEDFDYKLYQTTIANLGKKPLQQQCAPIEDHHTDGIAWSNYFELFTNLGQDGRLALVKAYLDGIDIIFRSNNHLATTTTTEVVGSEFTPHEILVMAFSRTSHKFDYPIPAHIYMQQRAFCLLSSARKGSIAAGALIRHFVSVLPEKALLDPEWSWTAVSYGLVLDWDLQEKKPTAIF